MGVTIMLLLFLFGESSSVMAQETADLHLHQDTVYRYFPAHSPVKATWMSAALPGLGQYYNGKYWKIPIIYAGFSTMAFFVIQNRYEYNRYKEAYAIKVELPEGQSSDNIFVENYSQADLLSQREYYQSSLELSYILTGVFYILQIVDATVDAHLYDYDIDDDLSIHFEPQLVPTEFGPRVTPGIGIRYKLAVD
ncbi:DUF5683 domain-containing protein [Lentimicrobium sp. S6]|uniref:DUF5683 domain-containing protein n=1 Tax=Lentimicrobium sp. S6 TaxID=2735872 RepID=UPI001551ECF8|nr:DUF5683 domain-containing protein [Lentimicrobium sp. S6]NPD46001.1 hypothetical protein [Lentimicrobium sp. S6]